MSAAEAAAEATLMHQLDFVMEMRGLREEPDPTTLRALAQQHFGKFVAKSAYKPVGCVSDTAEVDALERDVYVHAAEMHPSQVSGMAQLTIRSVYRSQLSAVA